MATSARFHWPPPRGFVSAYAQNLMAADTNGLITADSGGTLGANEILAQLRRAGVSDGWTATLDDGAVVMEKSIGGRRFRVISPPYGGRLDAGSHTLEILWILNRDDC